MHLPLLSLILTLLLLALPLAKGQQLEQCREPTTESVFFSDVSITNPVLLSLLSSRDTSQDSPREARPRCDSSLSGRRTWEVACSPPTSIVAASEIGVDHTPRTCLGRGNLNALRYLRTDFLNIGAFYAVKVRSESFRSERSFKLLQVVKRTHENSLCCTCVGCRMTRIHLPAD